RSQLLSLPDALPISLMILVFGFLFVTVSSRLTGEVGSSSNPISGMTIATLLMTCLIFLALGRTVANDPTVLLTALMVSCEVVPRSEEHTSELQSRGH